MEDIGSESDLSEAYIWRLLSIVLSKEEGTCYFEIKRKQNEFISSHPFVAKKLFINTMYYNDSRSDLR